MAESLAFAGAEVLLIARTRRADYAFASSGSHQFYGVQENFRIATYSWQNKSPLGALFFAFRGLFRILRFRPDLVVSRNLLGSWLVSFLGFSVVHEAHSPEFLEGTLQRFLVRTMMKRKSVKALVVISRSLREYFDNSGLMADTPVAVLPDGATEYEPTSPRAVQRRREFRVGYAGSIYAGRGIGFIASLAQTCHWAVFEVAGGAPGVVQKLRAKYKGIRNLSFLGHLSPSNVPDFLRSCDVLLAPYQATTADGVGTVTVEWMSPLKIFEYMAVGRPIISSDLPALREVLQNDVNAFLVGPNDVSAWTAALVFIRENPQVAARVAASAAREIRDVYAWRIRAKRVLSLVEERHTPSCLRFRGEEAS